MKEMKGKFGLNQTKPKDRSDLVYYSDKGELIASKPLLVFYKPNEDGDDVEWVKAQYVPSQDEWMDMETFIVYNVIGWVDIDEIIDY